MGLGFRLLFPGYVHCSYPSASTKVCSGLASEGFGLLDTGLHNSVR